MTISEEITRTVLQGTDGADVRAYVTSFKFLADADLTVIIVDTVTGTQTTKDLTTHYTVAGAGSATGTVTFAASQGTGGGEIKTADKVVLILDPLKTQTVDYQSGDPFPAETHELALDRLTNQVKRLQDQVDRTLTKRDGDWEVVSDQFGYYSGDGSPVRVKTLQVSSEAATVATPPAGTATLYLGPGAGGKEVLTIKWDDGATTVLATQA